MVVLVFMVIFAKRTVGGHSSAGLGSLFAAPAYHSRQQSDKPKNCNI